MPDGLLCPRSTPRSKALGPGFTKLSLAFSVSSLAWIAARGGDGHGTACHRCVAARRARWSFGRLSHGSRLPQSLPAQEDHGFVQLGLAPPAPHVDDPIKLEAE